MAAKAASSDVGVGSTVIEGLPGDRRMPGATPAGQRRNGGRLRGLHYHSTKDGKVRVGESPEMALGFDFIQELV